MCSSLSSCSLSAIGISFMRVSTIRGDSLNHSDNADEFPNYWTSSLQFHHKHTNSIQRRPQIPSEQLQFYVTLGQWLQGGISPQKACIIIRVLTLVKLTFPYQAKVLTLFTEPFCRSRSLAYSKACLLGRSCNKPLSKRWSAYSTWESAWSPQERRWYMEILQLATHLHT